MPTLPHPSDRGKHPARSTVVDRRAEALGIPAGCRLRAPLWGTTCRRPAVNSPLSVDRSKPSATTTRASSVGPSAGRWSGGGRAAHAGIDDLAGQFPAPLDDAQALVGLVLGGHAGVSERLARWAAHTPVFTRWERIGTWWAVRSTNPLERINKEIKRRSRVVGIFPDEASAIRLVGAILADLHDEWQATERRYLSEHSMATLCSERYTIATAELTPGN